MRRVRIVSAGVPARLNREAPLPLYAQLKDALLAEVRDGGLQPGDRFPTEAAIGDRYRVSRATVRQALADLEASGVIRQRPGARLVRGRPEDPPRPAADLLRRACGEPGVHAVAPRPRRPRSSRRPSTMRPSSGSREGTRCRFLRRLFLADGKAVGLAETWLPLSVLGGHDDLFERDRLDEGSMYEVLQRRADRPRRSTMRSRRSRPASWTPQSAELLGCDPGTPVLLIRRATFAPSGDAGRVDPAGLRRRALRVRGRAAPAWRDAMSAMLPPRTRCARSSRRSSPRSRARASSRTAPEGERPRAEGIRRDRGRRRPRRLPPEGAHRRRPARARARRARLRHEQHRRGRLSRLRPRRGAASCRTEPVAAGIVVDGAGIGSCMAANKVPGVRAATCWDVTRRRATAASTTTRTSSSWVRASSASGLALQIVDAWLATPWGGERHARRVEKITEIERRYLSPERIAA